MLIGLVMHVPLSMFRWATSSHMFSAMIAERPPFVSETPQQKGELTCVKLQINGTVMSP